MTTPIHIVCLDAPAPPDYGGAIDMYYKITALYKAGAKIILHYFDYKHRDISALKKYCSGIYAYKRTTGLNSLKVNLPHIVSSRINKSLINRLNEDNYPIVLEGIHCTGLLPYIHPNRKIVVRVHNNEAIYYRQLLCSERSAVKKVYYLRESRQLAAYQKSLPQFPCYACLSERDIIDFAERYSLPHLSFLPCFLPWQHITSRTGRGSYCLYHGNMQVVENERAAIWLIEKVFAHLPVPFIIAGKGLSKRLQTIAKRYSGTALIEHPTDDVLNDLIQQAHINILPSFNKTGVKLKLLHALFAGRHCITNTAGVAGSGLTTGFHIANTPVTCIAAIDQLMTLPFTEKDIQQRQQMLQLYNNHHNAERIISWLNLHCP